MRFVTARHPHSGVNLQANSYTCFRKYTTAKTLQHIYVLRPRVQDSDSVHANILKPRAILVNPGGQLAAIRQSMKTVLLVTC